MPGIARIKVWVSGEVLTASALNAEFNNVANNLLRDTAAENITSAWTFANGLTVNSGLTLGTALAVAQGGTGATTAAGARTNLGLGTLAVENASAVPAVTFASVTLYDEVVSLTDAATIEIDLSTGNLFTVTLGGDRTLDFTNLNEGVFILKVVQDGTGTRLLTHDAAEKWPGGVEPTLSTAAGSIDILTYFCDGTTLHGTSSLNYQ